MHRHRPGPPAWVEGSGHRGHHNWYVHAGWTHFHQPEAQGMKTPERIPSRQELVSNSFLLLLVRHLLLVSSFFIQADIVDLQELV